MILSQRHLDYDAAEVFILGDNSGLTLKDAGKDGEWMDGILIGDEEGNPGSVVKSDSWARIKASLLD